MTTNLAQALAPLAPVLPAGLGQAASPAGTILVVDDDAITRMVTAALLRQLGWGEALQAEDGERALAICASQPVSLVLMDCMMPVMDGLEATRRLRASGFEAPVVALSAGTDPSEVAQCLQAGMDAHLAKPVDRERLSAVLSTWMTHPLLGARLA